MKSKSFFFGLISNKDPHREKSKNDLQGLISELRKNYNIAYREISCQPPVVLRSFISTFFHLINHDILAIKWRRYCLAPGLIDIIKFPLHVIKNFFLSSTLNAKRKTSIEAILTDKHIRMWDAFIESDRDFLLCFEDDVVIKDDSLDRIQRLFAILPANRNDMVYIDLAGGFPQEGLDVSRLESGRHSDRIEYRKPVTNTSCAYLVSRCLVEQFKIILLNKPKMRFLSFDWMLNNLFIKLEKKQVSIQCFHFTPTIFNHGSFSGEYASTIFNHCATLPRHILHGKGD